MAIEATHIEDQLEGLKAKPGEEPKYLTIDPTMDYEVQTDKPTGKIVGCRECKRPLFVNTYYAPAKARCTPCGGGASNNGNGKKGTASIGQPKPGSTDPTKVVNLPDVLINKRFAEAFCPMDPGHTMELKSVVQNPARGPAEFSGYRNGRPEYRLKSPGESVLHQCLDCKATVAYSTIQVVQLRRQNEVREGTTTLDEPSGHEALLGARDEV